ncbi:MAG: N-formylglutamate amidohydrolase [Sphingomonadales bacterium]|nr:N-formylglutamate amidohydrolase [Sphingomonadales bacterium]
MQDTPPFRLRMPRLQTSAVIFASPHSGRRYPAQMLGRSLLDPLRLRSSEDAYVDRLLASAPQAGAPLLSALLPRAWVDLNRAEDELDPALIEGLRGYRPSPRVAAGLGVIPRVVSGGRAIYAGKIERAEAEERLALVWRPYHDALARLMTMTRARFGRAILIDVHSMPSESLQGLGPTRPDVVLGDRFGASAGADVVAGIAAVLEAEGLRVARNTPFAGAYIAERHGRPMLGSHVVQMEIDRALYLDEARVRPSADFDAFAALMARVLAALADLGRPENGRLAAE